MKTFRIICPDCGGAIVTAYPEAMIWELCPVCMRHIWDRYDVWLADACGSTTDRAVPAGTHLPTDN